MSNGYQINEKDIDSVLNYLKIHDPENATPELTIALLEFYKTKFHELAHTDLSKLEEIYQEFKNEQAKNTDHNLAVMVKTVGPPAMHSKALRAGSNFFLFKSQLQVEYRNRGWKTLATHLLTVISDVSRPSDPDLLPG